MLPRVFHSGVAANCFILDGLEIGKARSLAMSWLQTIHPVTVVVIACGFLLGASLTLAVITH